MDFSGIVPALPSLWEGMLMTLKLMVLGVLGGVALGTVLALMRLSHSKLLSNIAGFYVNYFRSIPLLLVITWFYFAVPFILRWITGEDTPVGAFTSCLVAFMMFEAAYYCEIVRAGIQAIPKGQMGAAQALGMTYGQTMRLVILPQAFRKMTPLLLQGLFWTNSPRSDSAPSDPTPKTISMMFSTAGALPQVRRRYLFVHRLSRQGRNPL